MSGYAVIPSGGNGGSSAGALCECYFSTLAEMKASQAPNASPLVYNFEVDGSYLFVPGDVTADDGWTSIASTNGVAGRWLLQTDEVKLSPRNDGNDDWARVNSAMAALAYKKKIILKAGVWLAAVAGVLASGTWIEMGPGVDIHSTIANVGFMSSIFAADGVGIDNGTVTTTPVLYSTSIIITMPTKPLVGQWIEVYHGTTTQVLRVEAISGGAAPWTVTTDRPIVYKFVATDVVSSLSSIPEDIVIDGKGAHLSGTGNQTIEIARGRNVILRDLFMDGVAGHPDGAGFGFDVGTVWGLMERLRCNMAGTANAPSYYLQSNERSILRDCTAYNGDSGAQIIDCYSSGAFAFWAYDTSRGLLFSTLPDGATASLGNFDCFSYGGGAVGGGIGCNVYGSRNTLVYGFATRGFTINGYQLELPALNAPPTSGTRIIGGSGIGCRDGIYVDTGVELTQIEAFDASEVTRYGLYAIGDTDVRGFTALRLATVNSVGILLGGTLDHKLSDVTIGGAGVSLVGVYCSGTGRVTTRDLKVTTTGGGGAMALRAQAGLAVVSGLLGSGGGTYGIYVDAGGTVARGPNVNISGFAVPFNVDPGGIKNWGTVTLVAGVGTYPWPLTRADDVAPVVNRLSTSQGFTGTGGWLVTKNAGVGVVVTSINIDGSTAATDEGDFDVYIPH